MKKIITTLLIFSGIYSVAFAQTKNTAEFGVNIGYNGAGVTYSGSSETSDYNSGFNLGISGEYYFSDRWSIKGKLSYDQKGWGNGFLAFDDGTEIDGINVHLNYLTIPVMANWHFGREKNWYLNFGPYAGFLLSANESSNSVDIKNAFSTTDFGLALGIGVKIPVSNKMNFIMEYDGQAGLTNIFKDSADPSTVQNVRSSFNIGLTFPLR
ncbi:MAG TPA: porin family protein [Mucilaginibacter sp.]|nr:porin family protein [Mucilaginibacter sp.]